MSSKDGLAKPTLAPPTAKRNKKSQIMYKKANPSMRDELFRENVTHQVS